MKSSRPANLDQCVNGKLWAASDLRVAMVNEKLARTYFPGVDPIGQRVGVNEIIPPGKLGPVREWEIVGGFRSESRNGQREVGSYLFPRSRSNRAASGCE